MSAFERSLSVHEGFGTVNRIRVLLHKPKEPVEAHPSRGRGQHAAIKLYTDDDKSWLITTFERPDGSYDDLYSTAAYRDILPLANYPLVDVINILKDVDLLWTDLVGEVHDQRHWCTIIAMFFEEQRFIPKGAAVQIHGELSYHYSPVGDKGAPLRMARCIFNRQSTQHMANRLEQQLARQTFALICHVSGHPVTSNVPSRFRRQLSHLIGINAITQELFEHIYRLELEYDPETFSPEELARLTAQHEIQLMPTIVRPGHVIASIEPEDDREMEFT